MSEQANKGVQVHDITDGQGVAVGDGATAVHIDAMGNVGDVITVAKMNLINHGTAERVASTRQIAEPPDSYIARPEAEAELAALLTAEHEGFHVVHLYGLPGVGKSWLARRVAKSLEEHFGDGTLWANLEHTKFRTAVKHFIEPYDQTINHNSLRSNSEYVAAMTEAFAGRRILIVLDQLDDSRDGLTEWLPSTCPNCVVLLVSQQPPSGMNENEKSYQLSGMTEAEALQLFDQLLKQTDGSKAYDDASLKALAEKLDYIPAAINTVVRDIKIKLTTPEDYLEILASNDDVGAIFHPHLPGLETVYDNLPENAKTLFPFLGILKNSLWTADDLYTISRKGSRVIETGLAQLERAGLIEKGENREWQGERPFTRYRTPSTISNFAFEKLLEIGGEHLIAATTVLQASDTMQKAEMVLRYVRQAILKECWRDENNRNLLIQSIDKQFANKGAAVTGQNGRSAEESTSMFAIPRDPLLDFFENVVLSNDAHTEKWLSTLRATDFPMLRNQLEEVFNWALEKEDWPLLRQFANNINVNTEWLIDTKLLGEKEERDWVKFNFLFPLLKRLEVKNFELVDVILKAPNIKKSSWENCQFIATKWLGAYIFSSTFTDIDMVGIEMPGGVIANSKFIDVDARYGDFRGTIFQKCIFKNVNFRGARFDKAKFVDCYFSRVDFRLTRLEEAFARNSYKK
ncbi:pentapeptide repeat-containing protein [Candidatus Leptofilum sp.]|uniref:pentapeptide repeat-containing protein n=1 Tax=Candidatus Leptofilum sp. TaxID=3241576 RepID=UPI003B59E918